MFISEIKYMKRKNLGNYEHKELAITISMVEEDNEAQALANGMSFVQQGLDGVVKSAAAPAPVPDTKAHATAEVVEEKPAKKPRKPRAAKKEVKADPKIYTVDDITAGLRAVAEKFKSKEKAIAVLEEFGVKKLAELKEEQYGDVVKRLEVVANG